MSKKYYVCKHDAPMSNTLCFDGTFRSFNKTKEQAPPVRDFNTFVTAYTEVILHGGILLCGVYTLTEGPEQRLRLITRPE